MKHGYRVIGMQAFRPHGIPGAVLYHPLFIFREVQVMASTISADRDYDPDVLAMIGSSAALHISQIPFVQPTGSVRIARVANQFVIFPSYAQVEESDLDLVVAGTKDAITMIEGFAKEMPEDQMYEAVLFAHDWSDLTVRAITCPPGLEWKADLLE